MKFIRDIIAEKKRSPSVPDEEMSADEYALDEANTAEPAMFRKGLDENLQGQESASGSYGMDQESTADLTVDENLDRHLNGPDMSDDEDESEDGAYNELSSIDAFDLNNDTDVEDRVEDRRQTLIGSLGDNNTDNTDESDLTPDEPADLRLSDNLSDNHESGETVSNPPEMTSELDATAEETEANQEAIAESTVTHSVGHAFPSSGSDTPAAMPDAPTSMDGGQEGPERVIEQVVEQAAETPAEAEIDRETGPFGEAEEEAPMTESKNIEPLAPVTERESATPVAEAPVSIPKPTAGRTMGTSGRVKTRLLGFTGPSSAGSDPFAKKSEQVAPAYSSFPVGWLAIVEGPGRGATFALFNGVSQIGRGTDQSVPLDFGDNSISRENHAAIAYDSEQRKFYLGHGGKANLVRLNKRPVLSTEELQNDDQIRIGETVLRFVALCGNEFCWEQGENDDVQNAAYG